MIWRNDLSETAYWADPLRRQLRQGSRDTSKTLTFNENHDLKRIATDEEKSALVAWLRTRSRFWSMVRRPEAPGWPEDFEFPVALLNAIEDPTILRFLPVSRALLTLFEENGLKGNLTRAALSSAFLRAARQADSSPHTATRVLLKDCGITEVDPDTRTQIKHALIAWRKRVASDERVAVDNTLWAWDLIQSWTLPQRVPGPKFPLLRSRQTYPLGALVGLLPSDVLLEPLIQFVKVARDHKALQYAAWCLGALRAPESAELWKVAREARSVVLGRRDAIGKGWQLVDRQLLYTEAQLGGEEAEELYVKRLFCPKVAAFEAAYNWSYYDGDADVIRHRFEQRLDECRRSDAHVRKILTGIYRAIRPCISGEVPSPTAIDGSAWSGS